MGILIKWIYIISFLLIMNSCTGLNNKNIVIHKTDLIIKSVDGLELNITNPARDSIVTFLKDTKMYNSDSLWFFVERIIDIQERDTIPAPPGFEDSSFYFEAFHQKYYTISGSNSIKEKNLFLPDLAASKTSYDTLKSYMYVRWDFIISVNLARDSVIEITQSVNGFLREEEMWEDE